MVKNLEKRVMIKDITAITCQNKTCELRGDYYKCYMDQQINCGLYHEYLVDLNINKKYENL